MLLAASEADVNFKMHCIELVVGEGTNDASVLGRDREHQSNRGPDPDTNPNRNPKT